MSKFPFYKQLDGMDCGPSCLRMIAKYYGKDILRTALPRTILHTAYRGEPVGHQRSGSQYRIACHRHPHLYG